MSGDVTIVRWDGKYRDDFVRLNRDRSNGISAVKRTVFLFEFTFLFVFGDRSDTFVRIKKFVTLFFLKLSHNLCISITLFRIFVL